MECIVQIEEAKAISFSRGDEQALSYFFHLLYPPLSLYAFHFVKNREVAEEIAADAFLKTWKHRQKLCNSRSIRAYLYAVVKNDCYRQLRKKIDRYFLVKKLTTPEANDNTGFDKLVAAEISRHIFFEIKRLSRGAEDVLKMHFIDGKSISEIACQLNISKSTVKTHKARGLQALKKKFVRTFLFIVPILLFCYRFQSYS